MFWKMIKRQAAREAHAAFEEPANKLKMELLQRESQGDIAKFFQLCIPMASEILSAVVGKHGFQPSQYGCVEFTQELSNFAEDPEIRELEKELKMHFMPSNFPPPA